MNEKLLTKIQELERAIQECDARWSDASAVSEDARRKLQTVEMERDTLINQLRSHVAEAVNKALNS